MNKYLKYYSKNTINDIYELLEYCYANICYSNNTE